MSDISRALRGVDAVIGHRLQRLVSRLQDELITSLVAAGVRARGAVDQVFDQTGEFDRHLANVLRSNQVETSGTGSNPQCEGPNCGPADPQWNLRLEHLAICPACRQRAYLAR